MKNFSQRGPIMNKIFNKAFYKILGPVVCLTMSVPGWAYELEVGLNGKTLYKEKPVFEDGKDGFLYFDLDLSEALDVGTVDRVFNKDYAKTCLYDATKKPPKEISCERLKERWGESISILFSGDYRLEKKSVVLSIVVPQKRKEENTDYSFDFTEMVMTFRGSRYGRENLREVAQFVYIMKDKAEYGVGSVLHIDKDNKLSFTLNK